MFVSEAIRAIREQVDVSQSVFARCLNAPKNLVSDWGHGTKRPGGPPLRLLAIVQARELEAITDA